MPSLKSLRDGFEAVIVGASGGIGEAFVSQLLDNPRVAKVHAWSRSPASAGDDRLVRATIDLTREDTTEAAAEAVEKPNLVIVATGLLHDDTGLSPEKSWRDLNADRLLKTFAVNAIGPALVAKHLLPRFPRDQRAIFGALSARVGSIEDNRLGGWYGYRSSKAALNQLIRTLSIELARTHKQAVCVGLHPGTVDTALSKPFQSNVSESQLFTPETSASHLLQVLDGLTPEDTGRQFAWDGKPVPA